MWNASATSAFDGGQEAELSFDQMSSAATSGGARRLLLELHAVAFQGRRSGPIAGSDTLRSAALLRATAPSDLGESAFLTIRSNDPAERDRVWAFIPALRRVRAVSPANRSDGLLGTDLSQDQLDCFDAKLEDFEWRLVGKQTILAPLTSVQPIARTALSATRAAVAVPSPRAAFEVEGATGAPWLIAQGLVMVPRPVWVVEGVPRDQYYLYGKLVLYVDAEVYRTYWRLAYGRNGEYVAHAMCAQHWSRSADGDFAGATPGTVMAVNEPLRRGTLMRYGSQVIDQELDRDFFTIAKMIEISR
jgi:Protein of unknown function (DUF1329)